MSPLNVDKEKIDVVNKNFYPDIFFYEKKYVDLDELSENNSKSTNSTTD